MNARDSGKKPAPNRRGGARKRWLEAAERVSASIGRLAQSLDPVDRALGEWAREMPDVETKGADVLDRARRAVGESRRALEENLRRHRLDAGEFDVLAALRRAGEPYALRPTELYRALMISSGGLTARLGKLEGAGLIKRRAAGDDARSTLVELTPAGKRKIEAAFRAGMEIENRMVSGLSDGERADLARLLRKLTQAVRG
jgi:DNA-binding MarR family transcriptional regulator